MYGTIITVGKIAANAISNPLAWLGGFLIGVITYLVQPGAAFFALWIVVACDLVSRLITESASHGGFIRAIREGHIQSDKACKGTMMKITAYFFMCVIANQSLQIFPWVSAAELFSNIVYSILFFVEVLSIAENFMEAGVEEFSWIKKFARKKLIDTCENDTYNYGNYSDYGGDNNEQSDIGDKPPV
ncbi:MAG: phage holin family protein [Syntrophomonadaceae bacterium]|jgi:hypothetical protein|nr:phage holin family protein [Syntrophomonadaceae bacterium]